MVRLLNPPGLGRPRGYNHGAQAGNLLFVSGQVGARPGADGRRAVSGGMAEQFAAALDNVLEVVRAAGGQPEHLAEMTVFVTDLEAYREARRAIGRAWKQRLGAHYPAMTLVEVRGLLEPGSVVELRAVAALP